MGPVLIGILIGVVFTAALFLAWPMSVDERREWEEFERWRARRRSIA